LTQPAVPRPSASVILVRDGQAGLETFMVRRHARSPVAPLAYVFPGGTLRSDDARLPVDPAIARAVSARSDSPLALETARAYLACAARELFEEAGVLLVRTTVGAVLAVDASDEGLQEKLASTRLALQAHELSFGPVLAEFGWHAAFDLLVPFSHWVTPVALAARFDTRFFVAAMPPDQAALHDTIELDEGVWLPPARALAADYHTVYATAQHLRRIAPFRMVADLLAFARAKPIRRVQPDVTEAADGLSVYIPAELIESW
jgi:8-oxo-dGTP pyrophosphatase MutT (NUDIX family)